MKKAVILSLFVFLGTFLTNTVYEVYVSGTSSISGDSVKHLSETMPIKPDSTNFTTI